MRGHDRYEVEMAGRRTTINARMSTLDDAQGVIGGHSGLVSAVLAAAAAIELRHIAPANVVTLEASCTPLPPGAGRVPRGP
ncbi:hypothetical protein OG369_39180 [Streptomyces sp. NBC_01221]|uniref:hypothetical protein n=1 Tax=Streptomyces sp. NBC_01221 TaxID=2903782 RepID=UPI002256870D|nr:hypothetical protein [Streptomyces sp. NBC_01221]MCX4791883.1 hypothetical protein [Streptomyces sp. NBC_01221]